MTSGGKRYLQGFGVLVLILALVRCIFPRVSSSYSPGVPLVSVQDTLSEVQEVASVDSVKSSVQSLFPSATRFEDADGNLVKHPIYSVPSYSAAFPDSNDVQMEAARQHGVRPVADRGEAERRKMELVYIAANPYYKVDKLYSSIPYLVPRAALLLQDIGHSFFDSLQVKGVPLHRFVVTSVLRSKADVERLRSHNKNATENSCHMYGTTFDIGYNRYEAVSAPGIYVGRKVSNDTLKWVLSEVLDDMRKSGRCYIKYEVKQGCFHITVR